MLIAKFVNPDDGTRYDVLKANSLLTVGYEYQVTDLYMGLTHTEIYLAGFVEPFNSVHFDFYENGREIDIFRDARYNPWLRGKRRDCSDWC